MDRQLCGTSDRYKTLSTLLRTTLLSSMLFPSIGLAMYKEDSIKKMGENLQPAINKLLTCLSGKNSWPGNMDKTGSCHKSCKNGWQIGKSTLL